MATPTKLLLYLYKDLRQPSPQSTKIHLSINIEGIFLEVVIPKPDVPKKIISIVKKH